MSHVPSLRRDGLALAAALWMSLSASGCGDPQAGSIDLSKNPVGIENEVRDAVKPAAKAPSTAAKAPSTAPKRP